MLDVSLCFHVHISMTFGVRLSRVVRKAITESKACSWRIMDYWSPCSPHAGGYQWHLCPIKSHHISSSNWLTCPDNKGTNSDANWRNPAHFTANKRALCATAGWLITCLCSFSRLFDILLIRYSAHLPGFPDSFWPQSFTCLPRCLISIFLAEHSHVTTGDRSQHSSHCVNICRTCFIVTGAAAEHRLVDGSIWLLIDMCFILVQCSHWGGWCESGLGGQWTARISTWLNALSQTVSQKQAQTNSNS